MSVAKLVINPTSASKREIPIASRVISIGRDPSNDLVLSDSMVSRRHAILEQRDNIYVLRDNNSSNGTMVNGDPVEAEKTLRDGDLLAIGSSRLLFQLEESFATGSDPSLSLDEPPILPESGDGAKDVAAGEPAPAAAPAADSTSCPTCGQPSVAGDRFCRACGSPLEERKTATCTACGHVVHLPADFCGQCGHELEKPKSPVLPTRHLKRSDLVGDAPLSGDSDEESSSPSASAKSPPRARPRPKRAPPPSGEAAGFGVRAIAAIIDGMIVGIPILILRLVINLLAFSADGGGALSTLALLIMIVGGPALSFVYHVFFWGQQGATPGKSLMGLSVETEDGESPIGLSTAALRFVGYIVSGITLGAGFFLIALSDDRRGLHDRIAGTRVVRTP